MNHLPDLVAVDTLLAVAIFFGCGVAVGRGRAKYKIAAPATTGHPDFERVFRVQMNTLEALAMFLPSLWVAAMHADRMLVGGVGLVWVVARIWYAIAYAGAAQKRNKQGLLFQGSIAKAAAGTAVDWEKFGDDFVAALATTLGAEAQPTPWPEFNEDELSGLVEQYSSPEWMEGR